MSKPTAKISDHTMAVFLAQEVATLTTKLEAAEANADLNRAMEVTERERAEKAEQAIQEISELQRWTAENMDINTTDVQFTTQPDGEVILFAELEAIIK